MFKTVYADLFPTKKDFFRHPFDSAGRFIDVYKMHVEQQTQVVNEMRMKKQEDVEKRKLYRLQRIQEAEERGEEYVEDPRYYIGEDGVRRRRVKRWFGIWE
jgi:cellulose biosynthesis protein BcsQ